MKLNFYGYFIGTNDEIVFGQHFELFKENQVWIAIEIEILALLEIALLQLGRIASPLVKGWGGFVGGSKLKSQ